MLKAGKSDAKPESESTGRNPQQQMKTKLLKYQSLALVTSLTVFAALWAMPGTARGQMFVSVNAQPFSNGGSFIYQYDPTGSTGTPTMPPFLSNLDHPREVAFDSAGNLYVATFTWLLDSQGNILGFDHAAILKVSGGVASSFATFYGGSAHGLVIDSVGNMFVSSQKFDATESTIYKVAAPDGTVSTVGSVPGQCFGLAVNSAGNLFAAGADPTLTYGSIYQFNSANVRSIFVGPGAFSSGPGPAGLTFDTSGNLFASTADGNGNGGILEFAPDGTESTFATGITNNPRGLAFDSAGSLFLAQPGVGAIVGDILKFTPGGTGTISGITTAPGFGVAYFDQGATGDFGTRGNRGPEYLAFAPGAITPPSTAVVLTFPDATQPLTTTVVTSLDQNSVPLPSPNFELTGSNLAFDITTTSAPTPPFIIAFTVSPSVYNSQLTAMHYDPITSGCDTSCTSNCQPSCWVDSTLRYVCDAQNNCNWEDSTPTLHPAGQGGYPTSPASNTVYASVNSLSPFLVAKFKYAAQVQQPINADGTSVFNAKRGVVPVVFTLTSDGVATCQLPPATISVFRTSGGVVGSVDESTYLLKSDSGSNFRIDSTKCQYVYNLGASSLGPGTYLVNISIGGSVAGSATFALK
jgi:hypothetical protein